MRSLDALRHANFRSQNAELITRGVCGVCNKRLTQPQLSRSRRLVRREGAMSPPLDPTLDTSVLLAGYLYLKLLRNRTALVFTTSLLHSPPNITKAISDIIPYSSNQSCSYHPASSAA